MKETQLELEPWLVMAKAIGERARQEPSFTDMDYAELPFAYTQLEMDIVERLINNPLANYREIADELGCSHGRVSNVRQRLFALGLVGERTHFQRRDGLVVRLKDAPLVEENLQKQPSYELSLPIAQVFGEAGKAIAGMDLENHPIAQMLVESARRKSDSVRQNTMRFIVFSSENEYDLLPPKLAEWRDALLGRGLAASTVKQQVGTVRARYKSLLNTNNFRDYLYSKTPEDQDMLNRKAFVDEIVERTRNEINPEHSSLEVAQKSRDVFVSKHSRKLWLTVEQAIAVMSAPGTDTLFGIRDTAMLATFLCTGVRRAELRELNVEDLRVMFDDMLSVNIRKGKDVKGGGGKQRVVVWGELAWCLDVIDEWLSRASIESGPVFRRIYKGGKKAGPRRIGMRSINKIVNGYEIVIDGDLSAPWVHDLRRTYARTQYKFGMTIEAIHDNLGHSQLDTTKDYIGPLDGKARAGRAAYNYKFSVSRGDVPDSDLRRE